MRVGWVRCGGGSRFGLRSVVSCGSVPATSSRRPRVVSGVQPTGALHLGNYLGAIRNWVEHQDEYEGLFFVVDWHAITLPYEKKELKQTTYQAAAMYLACGIDPDRSKVFVQSHVRAHAELTWLLNCITPMNWLERMIQYKEKARRQGENVSVGLFDYPVLMAADILLYQSDLVPVGMDQTQHLELARDIARRFNDGFLTAREMKKMRGGVFKEPKALLVEGNAKVMSLVDGKSKMSKSAESDDSRINLTDSPDVIRRKIKKCKTDSVAGLAYDDPNRPECQNLLKIYEAVSGRTRAEIEPELAEMTWGRFKPLLAEALIEHLTPIQARYRELIEDESYLYSILREGREFAEEIAEETMGKVRRAMGFAEVKDLYQNLQVPVEVTQTVGIRHD